MFFLVSKIVAFLFKPLTWSIVLFIFSLILKKPKWKKRLRYIGLANLLLFSNSLLFTEVARTWERGRDTYINQEYDVAIVLGGYASLNDGEKVNFHEANGRLMHAIALYKSGKAKKILLSGGSGNILNKDEREADLVASFLKENSIIKDDILIENRSKNTFQNAVYSKAILDSLKAQKVILITSGFHAYRAKKCFNKQNLYPDLLTTSYLTKPKRKFDIGQILIPNAKTLYNWEYLFKEWVGIVVYKLQGKI